MGAAMHRKTSADYADNADSDLIVASVQRPTANGRSEMPQCARTGDEAQTAGQDREQICV